MASPGIEGKEDSFADYKVTDYGNFGVVEIVGSRSRFEALSREEQDAFFDKLRLEQLNRNVLDHDLIDAIRNITPPLDEAHELQNSRYLEQTARTALESQGCPPCYPSNLDFPLHNVPPTSQGPVEFFQALPGTDGLVLRAQLSDWERFKNFRRCMHGPGCRYPRATISDDTSQQMLCETWLDFEYYHHIRHEQLLRSRDKERANALPEESSSRLNYAESNVRLHEGLLDWIMRSRPNLPSQTPSENKRSRARSSETLMINRRPRNLRQSLRTSTKTRLGELNTVDRESKSKSDGGRRQTSQPSGAAQSRHKISRRKDNEKSVLQMPRSLVQTRSGRVSKQPARWNP